MVLRNNIDFTIWPYLTWSPSTVKLDDVMGSNVLHYRYLHAKCRGKHVSHGMLVTFILGDICNFT